ncbi:peptidoglycan-binding domain-containing protein [Streptomyces guryensis]|uniref:Peptidoglycan-binding protein n=1 Tax=Streptomyces guryensis TaxID=2886947 RepID=A0A9Q3Z4C9_9ACTN|nr:peptidoglycan-binding domain-containing protein [Streptomyces guryensis]MCD9872669.1 peptidoglycan-binding protein [Streptomyces guryensis]
MTDPKGHQCPECGAPRGADNTPSCGCTQRASDALRDARTAEQAAAEDFDPLRIRPYVELEGAGSAPAAPPAVPAVEATMRLRSVGPEVPGADAPRLFEGAGAECAEDPYDEDDSAGRARRRRRTVLLGAGGAVVAVMTAAGMASGLFSYEAPTRDTALPDDVRASVPDVSPSSESASPPAPATSVRPARPAPVVSARPSLSPSPSATSASPSPSRSPEPSRPVPTVTASGSIGATAGRDTTPPVLRRGSEGPEVVELELRLTQLGLYTREPGGHYDEGVEDAVSRYQWARGIQGDELGVYGAQTRARLESETSQP